MSRRSGTWSSTHSSGRPKAAPEEDGVYQFVSRVARAYAGLGRADDARPSTKSEDVVPAEPAADQATVS